MFVLPETSLAAHHTLGIDVSAKRIVVAESVEDVQMLWQTPPDSQSPKLVLGKGSNVLFTNDSDVTIVLNRIPGIEHRETETAHYLHVGAGEDWPNFVAWAVDKGIGGLENLALIPGCVGSSPIQNIGAYGVELKDVVDYVDALNLDEGTVERLNTDDCQFGYRDSIFKHRFRHSHIIVAVGFRLSKVWTPVLNYGPLQTLEPATVTPREIFDLVCKVRQEKLPDPAVIGNAGSFFKNPVLPSRDVEALLVTHPEAPHYVVSERETKLAAGWLIDQCGLKGFRIGGAQVHPKQALVLTNVGGATAADIVALARHVVNSVKAKFGVVLEHEVRFYQGTEEVTLSEVDND
ncbi:UDP-N-acetylmuramate dehydrogenase [Thaumasiovibrio subtropicus]|uniref:UDP-N-acetylmuramate dehydrogenase n=1 Tax=Thaumasiovibrio subtropicus TaxID=1891207 RepID=UPI000B352A84|nr:UDP-N-acetylmuramate dehydrogenase [Thaumasiovibrio subtropicus]